MRFREVLDAMGSTPTESSERAHAVVRVVILRSHMMSSIVKLWAKSS